MSDLVDLLRALDGCDAAIAALAREQAEIPRVLAALDERIAAAQRAVDEEKRALEEAEKLRRTRERELADCETQRGRYQQQSALVKTNAEYTALLREIEASTVRIGEIEDAILLAMEEADRHTARLRDLTAEQQRVAGELAQQREQRLQRLAAVHAEMEARRAERATFLPKLDPSLRGTYERLWGRYGVATARIRGRTCDACHRDLPYEMVNRVRASEVHACLSCARLLVGIVE